MKESSQPALALKSFLQNLALALMAVVGTLALAELAIRHFVSIRNVGPAVSEYDPVYGVRLKRNFQGVQITPEFRMQLTTNSLGFRGPQPDGPQRGVLLYLGDSFTVGFGVDDGEEYAAIVADRVRDRDGRRIPYINAARGNSGQGHWLKFLRREAGTYAPRVVVLQIYENDFDDNIYDGLFRIEADSLIELPVGEPPIGRIVQNALDRIPFAANSHTLALARQAYHALSAGPEPQTVSGGSATGDGQNRLLGRLLEEVGSIFRERGWPAVAIRVALTAERDSLVESILARHAIRSRAIPDRQEMPGLYYLIDGHWTAAGHEHAADVVLELLAEADTSLVVRIRSGSQGEPAGRAGSAPASGSANAGSGYG